MGGASMVPRAGRDDAVSEVVGYVLTLGIGAVVIVFSFNTLLTAKDASDGMTTLAQLNQVADTVANHVNRVSGTASTAPQATYTILLTLPEGPGGAEYSVTIDENNVTVDSQPLNFTMTRAMSGLDDVVASGQDLVVTGSVSSHDGVVAIEYRWDPTTDQPTIEIKNV